jgi:hypothetical protein
MEKVINQEKKTAVYFFELSNDIINSSLKEMLYDKLKRDLSLRFTTEADKITYLHKLKKDLILHIDQETSIEVYQLIDIEEKETGFELNKNQFFDFSRYWLKLDVDYEKEVSEIIKHHRGKYSEMSEKLNELFARNNSLALAPEQITRLSFWMYCINSELGKIKEPETAVEVFNKEYFHPIFKNKIAQQFFEQRINEPGKYRRKFVSCLYQTLRGQIKPGPYDFAIYWNTHYTNIFEIKTCDKSSSAGIDTLDEKDSLLHQIKLEFEDFKQVLNLNK